MTKKPLKILLVRCPKYMWPWVNESDNFLLPLGLPSIAASLRNKKIPGVELKIIDCPPLKIGWKSLEKILIEEKPDIVGAGEEALYHHESIRLFHLSKKINPSVINIAGGHYFSWVVENSLRDHPVDIIVRFEGEETFPDLIDALVQGKDLAGVLGIAYKNNGKVVTTPPRPLIRNLDDLPVPAYDLMPMRQYAPEGIFWPESATIEASRGCVDTCSYCALWTFWGKHNGADISHEKVKAYPHIRRKSVARTMQEVELLCEKYDRKILLWADPTFNTDPEWTRQLCEEIIRRKYKIESWVFLRADYCLRDEKLGVLELMVKAGFVHVLFGVERSNVEEWGRLDKHGYKRDEIKELFSILKTKYPQVFRQATFVTCLPFDNAQSMLNLAKYAVEIDCDFPVFHPATPTPGTPLYDEMIEKGFLEVSDLKEAYWEYPLLRNENGMSRAQLAALNRSLHLYCLIFNIRTVIRGLFSKYPTKRLRYKEVIRVFVLMAFKIAAAKIKELFSKKTGSENLPQSLFFKQRKPAWYEG